MPTAAGNRARTQYVRRNGPLLLSMTATGTPAKLPFGNIPRLLLAWVCTEAVRTQSRTLKLGRSLAEFMRKLDITSDSGGVRGNRTRVPSLPESSTPPHPSAGPGKPIRIRDGHRGAYCQMTVRSGS